MIDKIFEMDKEKIMEILCLLTWVITPINKENDWKREIENNKMKNENKFL